jgi:fatty-acyl-CoA synthase
LAVLRDDHQLGKIRLVALEQLWKDIEVLFEVLRQLAAEFVRAPAFGARVVPELLRARRRGGSLLSALHRHARARPDADALVTDTERVSYGELRARVDVRRAWLRTRGVAEGDAVLIVGSSGIEYACLLLACSALGATAVLAGSELSPSFIERALELTEPKLVLANGAALSALARFSGAPPISAYESPSFWRELASIEASSEPALPAGERCFAGIFTSGTTGPSKLHRISESRALFAATVFARLVHRLAARDRLYCCLPLHHASGLLLGLGTCLVAGVPLVLRERFSASAFFEDVRRHEATVALYIGEIGRALSALPPTPRDREHPLRLLVGNGLGRAPWAELSSRFAIREIAEFYAATEFPGSIVNLTGKLGSVGHVPFERLRGYRLVRVDDDGELVRDVRGFASRPASGEPGELLMRVRASDARGPRHARDLFRSGDAYVRSGDLFRRDRAGYYWFVDRLGESFRFKGELVATRDVEDALERAGVRGVSIVGVRVPGVDGKAGLAVAEPELDRPAFLEALPAVPHFARPRFLRLASRIELGPTFKLQKRRFAEQGVDPDQVSEPLYLVGPASLEPLTPELWQRIVSGSLRL